jgi:hypothetical protein
MVWNLGERGGRWRILAELGNEYSLSKRSGFQQREYRVLKDDCVSCSKE